MAATHEVFNQSVPLHGHNAASNDVALLEALDREGAAWAADDVAALGARVGDPEVIALGELANTYPRCCAPSTVTGVASTRSTTTRRTTS